VHGGAIDSTDDLAVSNSTFESNTAVATGGAIYNEDAAATIVGSTFQENSAPTGAGGAVDSRTLGPGATLTVSRSTFTNNQALGGGALSVFDGMAEITDSTFNLNSANGNGGAINSSGDVTMINSTISTNAADQDGGGLFNVGHATILNSTFAKNSSLTDVGGIFSDGAGSLDITNTIVTTGILGGNCAIGGLPTGVQGSNLSDDDSCPAGLFTQVDDGKLGALADNGGPTLTHLPDPTSPAVDGGDDAACPDKDQRGQNRIAVDHCDVGSVEVQDVPFVPTGDLFLPNLASQVDHQ
jgi:predicted outer membrane repeat protein